VIIYLLRKLGQYNQLWERAIAWEVGPLGFVLAEDERAAAEKGITPLNSFERWVLLPAIKEEKKFRRDCLDEAERIVLG
jgi:hypothetical protein